MTDGWEIDSSVAAGEDATSDVLDEQTRPYLAPHRRTTEKCPLCGMRNALSVTEVVLGYLCEECSQS